MYLLDKDYNVYVDVTILGRHDPNAPKRTYICYVVDGIEQLKGVKEITAEETDDAECKAILFAISELKGKLKQFTIFCDHQSVVSEAKRDTPTRNPLIVEIRQELANSKIRLNEFPTNPAHVLLNKYLANEADLP